MYPNIDLYHDEIIIPNTLMSITKNNYLLMRANGFIFSHGFPRKKLHYFISRCILTRIFITAEVL